LLESLLDNDMILCVLPFSSMLKGDSEPIFQLETWAAAAVQNMSLSIQQAAFMPDVCAPLSWRMTLFVVKSLMR
jgi:hypothetical protein